MSLASDDWRGLLRTPCETAWTWLWRLKVEAFVQCVLVLAAAEMLFRSFAYASGSEARTRAAASM